MQDFEIIKFKNKNVIIGRGDVDFDIIFEKLKDIKYKNMSNNSSFLKCMLI